PMRVHATPRGRPSSRIGPDDVVVCDDVRVAEILGRLSVRGDVRWIVADLLMWEHHPDAHGGIIGAMEVEHRRAMGPVADPTAIEEGVRKEARDVYGWSNGPGDRYGEHEHAYTKLLYCTRLDRLHPRRWPPHRAAAWRSHGVARDDASLCGGGTGRVRLRGGEA